VTSFSTSFLTDPWSSWQPRKPEYTAEEKAGYREQFEAGKGCVQCGGLHLHACPRVKRLVMRNKEEISEVEFWPWGQWPADQVVWPADVYEEDLGQGTESDSSSAPGV